MAGGESRDTIPTLLELLTRHPAVDAVIYLGIGIQAANAQVIKTGPFYPGYGLDRIVAFHERQDARYAEVAKEISERYGKPVLCASELAHTDREGHNPAPRTVAAGGRITYPSAHRAVRALAHLVHYAEWRRRREGA
jgi:acetyltransferase